MTHERFDDLTEELSAESRRLERKISDLVSLRKLVAEKRAPQASDARVRTADLPGKLAPRIVKRFQFMSFQNRLASSSKAFWPTEAPSSKQNSELRGAPKWRPQLPPRRVMGPFLIQIPSQPLP